MCFLLVRHGDGGVLVQIISQYTGPGFLGSGDDKIELADCGPHSKEDRLSSLCAKQVLHPPTLSALKHERAGCPLAPQARCLCYVYFQLRTFPSASQAMAVCKRWDRVSSRFASVSQSRYSFLLV